MSNVHINVDIWYYFLLSWWNLVYGKTEGRKERERRTFCYFSELWVALSWGFKTLTDQKTLHNLITLTQFFLFHFFDLRLTSNVFFKKRFNNLIYSTNNDGVVSSFVIISDNFLWNILCTVFVPQLNIYFVESLNEVNKSVLWIKHQMSR